jgi:hypothetical protein
MDPQVGHRPDSLFIDITVASDLPIKLEENTVLQLSHIVGKANKFIIPFYLYLFYYILIQQ